MHCNRFQSRPLTRREMLARCACGFGSVALAGLAQATAPQSPGYRAKAKSVIFLYMDGGVSQVDSFDPKPALARYDGQPFNAKIEPTQFDNVGTTLASPWKFRRYGECGLEVSDLFPHIGRNADKLAVMRGVVSDFSEHNTANYFLHTGFGQAGRPSMGAWLSYGLGCESNELPTFVVLNGGLVPSGGADNFAAGFLPALHQATMFKPQALPVANLDGPAGISPERTHKMRSLLASLDAGVAERYAHDDAIESAISNYELAYRMQLAVPDVASIDDEPEYIQRLYGVDHPFEATRVFARECLLARRLIERGVRFIEMTCPNIDGCDRWDAHSNLVENHSKNALATDQPIGALLQDLDARGMLDDTLVVWAGEFGRTPFAQGTEGRDHNPFGYTVWMAGGGVRGGTIYGATDDFGYRVVDGRVTIHDLHATMLHQLGIDHTKLTYRFGGRDMRLTDVHGELITAIL
ncbi:DUF1501 domain-containing protein [Aeoliella sp. SH292]|uniref:DUF1501 domain-containing protein n=1 Tax=Aeoliella sp. SH292 TaxID=3454464 RepID=UPI003F97363C